MDTEILCALIAGACTIICAVVGAISLNAHNKNEKREAVRREEAFLSLQLLDACLSLSTVCSIALTGGKLNGNVEEAREAAEKASEAYKAFMQKQTVYAISK